MPYRILFTHFLQGASANPRVNAITLRTVSVMNDQMARRGVAMSREHYEVAQQSIARGDDLCDFLRAENKHVLESTGTGVVYQAGVLLHRMIGVIEVAKTSL